jgi:pSer/pThr/pTyr-binding forkhead associated (FHA) protein
MTCPSCGTPNPADFMFCLQCGQRLSPTESVDEVQGETRAELNPLGRSGSGGQAGAQSAVGGIGDSRYEARFRVEQGSVDEQVIVLDRPAMIVGRRQQGSDIVIHDTNVSRQHARIERQGDRITIEDTNSSNGTIVNDEKIEAPIELRPGDVVRIGDAVFVFEQAEVSLGSPEGSTMALDLDSPMTSLGSAPELVAPGLVGGPMGPLTPPPAIMDVRSTGLSDSYTSPEPEHVSGALPSSAPSTPPGSSNVSGSSSGGSSYGGSALPAESSWESKPSEPSWSPGTSGSRSPASPSGSSVPGAASLPPIPDEPAWSSAPSSGPPSAGSPVVARPETIDALRRELSEVGGALVGFAGTLGGLADRVERLEHALDEASGDLNRVSEAVRGPDATVLRELQGILEEIERDGNTGLDEAMQVLSQLAAQPRDIELLLKLSQQAGAIESALRIHGRLVAIAPRIRASLARLVS